MSIEVDGAVAAEKNSETAPAFPIGFVYKVYPGKSNPGQLGFPGTWQNISSEFAGLFEGIEGGDRLAFGGGVQPDQMQGHEHDILGHINGVSGDGEYLGDVNAKGYTTERITKATQMKSDGTNGAPRVGMKTYPENITVQLWERTA